MEQFADNSAIKRIKIYYIALFVVLVSIALRLFYLQVIKHDYYENLALSSQLKQFEIPADRGGIYAYDGTEIVPLVLNETRYRIVADPEIITDKGKTAKALEPVVNIPADQIKSLLERDSRYEIIANKQTKDIKDKIDELKLAGIFTNE